MFEILVAIYLLVLNITGFVVFAYDKRASIRGDWRVPEDRMLAVAFLGGSIGAKLGQMLLHHKTRKEPFRQQLNGILTVQIVAMAALFAIWMLARG